MPRSVNDSPVRTRGWLSGVPGAFRDAVLARCDVLRVAAGVSIYQAGDEGGGLYGVLDGRVEVHLHPAGETPTLIHIVGPGFWTGEFSAVTGRPRIIGLTAHRECSLLRLSRAELLRITEGQPEAWAMLTQLVLRNQASLLSLLAAVRCADPVQRVALTLLNLAREMPEGEEGIGVSQTEIGAIACMSRGAVNAALATLEGRGLIRRIYRGVGIVSIAGLTAFATGS